MRLWKALGRLWENLSEFVERLSGCFGRLWGDLEAWGKLWEHDRPKMIQDGARMATDGARMVQDGANLSLYVYLRIARPKAPSTAPAVSIGVSRCASNVHRILPLLLQCPSAVPSAAATPAATIAARS